MPLLWRYLLGHYLKTFFLCVAAFLAILITLRFNEIAYFATLGAEITHIVWFALQQIPYIIPIALPVSALISSILLTQQLSISHELTALRASGFALRDILAPILIAALFLSSASFYITSELSTASHLNAGLLKDELRSINPLLLLNNKNLMQIKGFYFDTLGHSKVGEFAQDVILLSPNRQSGRLNMLIAKELQASSTEFSGRYVTLLTSQSPPNGQQQENLLVENMKSSTATIDEFSQMINKKAWSINNDHLRLSQLLVRLDETRAMLTAAKASSNEELEKDTTKQINCCLAEIMRRISVSLAVFTFTLMGLAFGISISRNHSNRGVFCVIILAAQFLICFFIAKNFEQALIITSLLYLIPHLIISIASLWMLKRTARGIE